MFAPRGGLTPAHTAALTFAAAAITAAAIFAAALAAAAAASALLESLLEVDPRLRPAAADAILHPYFTANFSDRLVASGDLLRQDEKLEALRALIRQVPRGGNGRPSFFHLTKAFAKCLTRALGRPPAGFRGACALCGSCSTTTGTSSSASR